MNNESNYQNVNFRMNRDVKKQFDGILAEIGLNPSTAFNMFARLVVRENGLPFPIIIKKESRLFKDDITGEARQLLSEIREESAQNGTDKLTMEEINAEIALYRKEKRKGKDK